MNDSSSIQPMVDIITRLRAPNGCPWDRQQTPSSLAVYMVEEVFELFAAIASGNTDDVCEELGDVLFQVLFVAVLYADTGAFDLAKAVSRNCDKMIRRHPHVFGQRRAISTEAVRDQWHKIKKEENGGKASPLDSIPKNLPAIVRAWRILERAEKMTNMQASADDLIGQVDVQWQRLKDALNNSPHGDGAAAFGETLLTLISLARCRRIHPETALAGALGRLEKRLQDGNA
jgi:tetrapyrrole methylase family protein/MazG family protein